MPPSVRERTRQYAARLLRSATQRFGLDMHYWVTNSFWTSIPVGLEVLTNIVLAVVYTHEATQQVFGEYRFYFAALSLFAVLGMPWITAALIRAVARGYHGSFRKAFLAFFRLSFLVALAFLLGAAYFFFTHQNRLWPFFLLTGFLIPFFTPFRIYIPYLQACERFQEAAIYLSLETLISFGVVLSTILLDGRAGIVWLSYLVSRIIVRVFFFSLVRRRYPETWTGPAEEDVVRYGVHLTMSNFFPSLLASSERILITMLAGLDGLALFSVARSIAKPTEPLIRPLTNLFLPRLSKRGDARGSFRAIARKLPLLLGLTAIINLVFFALAPWIFSVLYPPSYAPGIILARILFIGQFVVVANILLKNFLIAHKRTVALYVTTLVPQLVSLACMVLAFPLLGLVGFALAVLLRNYLLFAGFLFASWRRPRSPHHQ